MNNNIKTIDIVQKGLTKRYRAEKRFRLMGISAIIFSFICLAALFISIFGIGYSAFQQTVIELDIVLETDDLNPHNLASADFNRITRESLFKLFPEVSSRKQKRKLLSILSPGAAFHLSDYVKSRPEEIGSTISLWFPADDDVDMLMKGYIDRSLPEKDRRIDDEKLSWIENLEDKQRIRKKFNTDFFLSGDSREPELAGILGAAAGSFFTLIITLLLSFPIGAAAAVYLEEFAAKNRFTDIIEVNINNLAAVPSIIFGLLGLAIFLNFFGMPRSSSLTGGIVLTLMTLPTIIIAGRAALKSVPPSIREAALGIGASKTQMVLHHVLPLAMPGMLTGTIIGMARALGETAPLLMIGMVAFIGDIPGNFTDPATALPVQVYLWAESPERAFLEKTSAAIIVLLVFLVAMNSAAVILRKKYEKRW